MTNKVVFWFYAYTLCCKHHKLSRIRHDSYSTVHASTVLVVNITTRPTRNHVSKERLFPYRQDLALELMSPCIRTGNTYFTFTVYHTDIIHLLTLYLLKDVQIHVVSAALLANEVQAFCRIQYTNMNIYLITQP